MPWACLWCVLWVVEKFLCAYENALVEALWNEFSVLNVHIMGMVILVAIFLRVGCAFLCLLMCIGGNIDFCAYWLCIGGNIDCWAILFGVEPVFLRELILLFFFFYIFASKFFIMFLLCPFFVGNLDEKCPILPHSKHLNDKFPLYFPQPRFGFLENWAISWSYS